MNFVFPSFLYALSAISVPILIHLFNFRRYKKLYFSNVSFLQEVVQASRSRSTIKHLLVLLCRILVIGFLVLAFAQPYTPLKNGLMSRSGKAVSIFIDNSFSMNAAGQNGTLLDEAKDKAKQIAMSLSPEDKVQLVSQDFDEEQERWLNKQEFIQELGGLKTSPASHMLSNVLKRQNENLAYSRRAVKEIFVLSDFQKPFADVANYPHNNIPVNFIPILASVRNNLSIDSCWFSSPLHIPDKTEELTVSITNYSATDIKNNSIKLFLNGEQKALGSYSVAPGLSTLATLTFTPDNASVEQGDIQINDYPITFDNNLYFSFSLSAHIPVLRIYADSNSVNPYLNSLYGKDSLFTYQSISAGHIDYSSLASYRLIILDGLDTIESGTGHELVDYLNKGGNLLVIPPPNNIGTNSYKDFLTSAGCSYYTGQDTGHLKVAYLNYQSYIYSGVFEKKQHNNMDMPVVTKYYTFSAATKSPSENLMKLENQNDFLNVFHYGKGNLYLLAVALNNSFSNFQAHALFVPTLYNIGLFSTANSPLYYVIGSTSPIEVPDISLPQNTFFRIKANKDTLSLLPEKRVINNTAFLFLHNIINKAGDYKLYAGDSLLSGISFNYNRKESSMSFVSAPALQKQFTDAQLKNFSVLTTSAGNPLSNILQQINRGKYYWKYCIILALLFLATEQALLRLWKE